MKTLITGALGHIGSYVADNIHKIAKIKETILIDNFESNLTIDVSILDHNNEFVYSQSWDERITVDYYEETKSKNKHSK